MDPKTIASDLKKQENCALVIRGNDVILLNGPMFSEKPTMYKKADVEEAAKQGFLVKTRWSVTDMRRDKTFQTPDLYVPA